DFNITLFDFEHEDQGIVHVIGPEMGFTLPGTTIVCGDSHTATHGAFGALAFGIVLTVLVQSSSITTSLVVPLVGAGRRSQNPRVQSARRLRYADVLRIGIVPQSPLESVVRRRYWNPTGQTW
ncbi:hypothetical protein LCGC14_3122220, partial [marine sediment metagenome]